MMKTSAYALLLFAASAFSSGQLSAQSFGKNLLVNGDAEASAGTSGSTVASSIPGWTGTGSPNVILYSANNRLSATSLGPASRGKNYFAGSTTALGVLTQKIDVSAAAAGIDAGTVSFDASGYLGGESGDSSSMKVTFMGASGNSITSFTLGSIADDDKLEDAALYFQRKLGQMPTGTRSVTVELDMARSGGINNDGCADNLSFQMNDDSSLPQNFFGSNLIANGNAEAPSGIQLPSPLTSLADAAVLEIPGWVRSGHFSLDVYSNNSDLTPTDPGPTDRGSWYFYGGPSNPSSNAVQDIDAAGAAAQIDAGKVTFAFSGWLGGYSDQNDAMTVTAQFMNWAGTALSTSTLSPALSTARGGKDGLVQRSQSGAVPAGTRFIRITMTSTRTDGLDNDGLADSLSLVLTAPGSGAGGPSIQSGGVLSASAFGGFSAIAPGSWIEIYGSNLAGSSRQWAGSDFAGTAAPTSLDGTKVSIGGQPAFVGYISPGQINVQAPSNVSTGTQQVIVTTANGASAAYPITVNATQAGLLAPPLFMIGGKQYIAALHTDGTFVLPPNAISGVASRQAQPGETILMYGVGFGGVTPGIAAGQIVGASNQLALTMQMQIGSGSATLAYDGLAPGYVGLYQFNVVVPNVADSDLAPLSVTLGGAATPQTLYTAVKR